MNTNLDDWETDPDFIREMDEMDQRWGSKRTVGSINMNELIDGVRRDHKTIREKNHHSSQRDYATEFSRDQGQPNSAGFETRVSRKVITESRESSYVKENNRPGETTSKQAYSSQQGPIISPKPDLSYLTSRLTSTHASEQKSNKWPHENIKTEAPKQFRECTTTKRIFEEREESNPPSRVIRPGFKGPSGAFKSIEDKIDAFKKEFESIENKVATKSDISKVIKKSTNVERFDREAGDAKYVSRNSSGPGQESRNQQRATTASPDKGKSSPSARPFSTSPLHGARHEPAKTSIKSLSEKFESLGRETSEDFRRRMEDRRREFFDEIKSQVRETRKGLDGFDIIDSDEEGADQAAGRKQGPTQSGPSSRVVAGGKPKVYTKRETTQIVSRLVKENDRVIHDETKRNVERTSSHHGSSDEETGGQPTSLKHTERDFKQSPPSTSSPIDELRRKVPYVEPGSQNSGLMARTLYDYQAAESDELSFDIDELITNIEKLDKGWYKGTITRGASKQVGLFPANYVKLLNDSGFY